MKNSKVQPQKESQKIETETKDISSSESSIQTIKNEPARARDIGSSIVRRNEADDED